MKQDHSSLVEHNTYFTNGSLDVESKAEFYNAIRTYTKDKNALVDGPCELPSIFLLSPNDMDTM